MRRAQLPRHLPSRTKPEGAQSIVVEESETFRKARELIRASKVLIENTKELLRTSGEKATRWNNNKTSEETRIETPITIGNRGGSDGFRKILRDRYFTPSRTLISTPEPHLDGPVRHLTRTLNPRSRTYPLPGGNCFMPCRFPGKLRPK